MFGSKIIFGMCTYTRIICLFQFNKNNSFEINQVDICMKKDVWIDSKNTTCHDYWYHKGAVRSMSQNMLLATWFETMTTMDYYAK